MADLPPFDHEAFNKWTLQTPVIVHTDMEEQMLNEAKEQVVTGFEKFSSGSGVNTQVSNKRNVKR